MDLSLGRWQQQSSGETPATLYIRHYSKVVDDGGKETIHTVDLGFIKVVNTMTSVYTEGTSVTIPVYKGDIYVIARNNKEAAEEVLMFIGKD